MCFSHELHETHEGRAKDYLLLTAMPRTIKRTQVGQAEIKKAFTTKGTKYSMVYEQDLRKKNRIGGE